MFQSRLNTPTTTVTVKVYKLLYSCSQHQLDKPHTPVFTVEHNSVAVLQHVCVFFRRVITELRAMTTSALLALKASTSFTPERAIKTNEHILCAAGVSQTHCRSLFQKSRHMLSAPGFNAFKKRASAAVWTAGRLKLGPYCQIKLKGRDTNLSACMQ